MGYPLVEANWPTAFFYETSFSNLTGRFSTKPARQCKVDVLPEGL